MWPVQWKGVFKIMQLNLRCSDSLQKVTIALLEANGIQTNPKAVMTLLERGFEIPAQGLSIVFDAHSLGELTDLLATLGRKPDNSKALIVGRQPDSETWEIIALDDISYFEAEGNYAYCLTAGRKLRVKNKMYELEVTLLEQGFIRISKSLIVNIMNVAEITPWFGSRLLLKLKGGQEIEVSRNYVKGFKEFLEL